MRTGYATPPPPEQIGDTYHEGDTRVLVLGTLHTGHRRHDTYSYEHVSQMIAAFDPDAICVEIRPEEFRVEPYLMEMTLATIQGTAMGIPVYPIDWWDEASNDRDLRAQMAGTREFNKNARQERKLERKSTIIREFHGEYGEAFHDRADEFGPEFWNGEAYNRYIREGYRISVEVWGDSPVNLHYVSRNGHMLERIREALGQHPGQRVMVLTGAEHKHVFDDALMGDEGVFVEPFSGVMVPQDAELLDEVAAYLETRDARLYYDLSDPVGELAYISEQMTRLMHGPDMDFQPNNVPAANVPAAAALLERWREIEATSVELQFETAWHDLHAGHYERAIDGFDAVRTALEADPELDEELWFDACAMWRNIGLCHDLLGDRQEALQAYERYRSDWSAANPGRNPAFFGPDTYLGNAEEEPFRWSREPALPPQLDTEPLEDSAEIEP